MKTKLIVTSIVVALAVTFFSFKTGEKEGANVALVMAVYGKGDQNKGYMIMYGDGTSEMIPFEIKYGSSENALETAQVTAKVMNLLHDKNYRFVGNGATPNSYAANSYNYMIFEKK